MARVGYYCCYQTHDQVARVQLSFHRVIELCCLHPWIVDIGMTTREAEGTAQNRVNVFERFAFLNLRREVEQGPEEE